MTEPTEQAPTGLTITGITILNGGACFAREPMVFDAVDADGRRYRRTDQPDAEWELVE